MIARAFSKVYNRSSHFADRGHQMKRQSQTLTIEKKLRPVDILREIQNEEEFYDDHYYNLKHPQKEEVDSYES